MEIESVSCVTQANVISNRLLSRKRRKTLAVSHIFDGENADQGPSAIRCGGA
jgi:hypothetical protein